MTWPKLGNLVHHCGRRANLPRRTIAALKGVVVDKGLLQLTERIRRADALNGGNLVAVMHDGKGQAAVNALTVNNHGASAALTVVAAFFRAG